MLAESRIGREAFQMKNIRVLLVAKFLWYKGSLQKGNEFVGHKCTATVNTTATPDSVNRGGLVS